MGNNEVLDRILNDVKFSSKSGSYGFGRHFGYNIKQIVLKINEKYSAVTEEPLTDCQRDEINTRLEDLANQPEEPKKFILTTEILAGVFEQLKITYEGESCKWLSRGHVETETNVKLKVSMHFRNNGLAIPETHIREVVQGYKLCYKDLKMDEVDRKLGYDSKAVYEPVLRRIYEVLKIKNSTFEAFKVALRHWCWCVKRKWHGEQCQNQLVINFYTAQQGTGKTSLTQDICNALLPRDYHSSLTLENIFDTSRCYNLLSELFIARLDEWSIGGECSENKSKMTVDQLNLFKSIVTENETKKVRAMGGDSTTNVLTNISFIGSSNTHYYDSFPRAEETRRFVEFEVGKTPTDLTEDEFREFRKFVRENFHLVAKSVDEEDENGYFKSSKAECLAGTEEIKQMQEKDKTAMEQKDSVISFVTEAKKNDSFGTCGEFKSWENLYKEFTEYCQNVGISRSYVPQLSTFKNRVCINLGIDPNNAPIELVGEIITGGKNLEELDELPF